LLGWNKCIAGVPAVSWSMIVFEPTLSLRPNPGVRASYRFIVLALGVVLLVSALPTAVAQAQKESVLYSFKDGPDGVYPATGVVADAAGNLYGSTLYGGAFGWGTVFKISKGVETVLYGFTGKADGAYPGGLFIDSAGNIYGTTQAGGNSGCDHGCGTVFRLSPTGQKTTLHRFTRSATDGWGPTSGLVQDAQGNFYGTTEYGGTIGAGTVFKLDTAGKETVLYSFTGGSGGSDGSGPNGVILDSAGNLYGTTAYGGEKNFGTVFKLDTAGKETVLYAFNGGTDGENPLSNPVRDATGNLYGTTNIGGAGASGTIFRVDPSGSESILYSFQKPGDGAYPGDLILDAGNLYGNTEMGGRSGDGAVFEFSLATSKEAIIYSFDGRDGQYPSGGLILGASGSIYGTTEKGGAYGWGAVFTIIP